jgi:hypothetical protein
MTARKLDKSQWEGKFIFCTLADEAVLDLMSALRRIAEQNIAEVERVP